MTTGRTDKMLQPLSVTYAWNLMTPGQVQFILFEVLNSWRQVAAWLERQRALDIWRH
jgi:hypothetical protein